MKKFLLILLILLIPAVCLCSCNNKNEPYLIFDRALVGQELVDSIQTVIPESIYIELKIVAQDDVSYMTLVKHNNIFVTTGKVADGINVVSVYDYNTNMAYQYFTGDKLSEEEKTNGIELSLTRVEVYEGIDNQFESLSDLGNVSEAYLTNYKGKPAIYIKSSYKFEESELVFTIYMSTEYSYPLYMLSCINDEDSVEVITTKIDRYHAFSKSFPDIPKYIEFINYDN